MQAHNFQKKMQEQGSNSPQIKMMLAKYDKSSLFLIYQWSWIWAGFHSRCKLYEIAYSLRPKKKQVTLEFKNCLNKQVILPYLESVCACKNQLVPNMDSK